MPYIAAVAPGVGNHNQTPTTDANPEHSAHPGPDPGLGCLVLIARFHGIATDPDQIRHDAAKGQQWLTDNDLILAAKRLGLKAKVVTIKSERLARTPCPAMLLCTDGRRRILVGCDSTKAMVLDPYGKSASNSSPAEVMALSDGRLMLFASRSSLYGELAHFDFSWFIPAVIKYRRLLTEVLLVSFGLQLFGLMTPLMFQVVMDKVLVNRAYSTLTVVCVALLLVTVFETLLTGLRNYVFAHTATRIDVELGARLYRHLLDLPIKYFGLRRVGDTVARVRELESIRHFLTSHAITALMDLFFSFVFIGVMLMYSVWLTLVVLASLPLYVLISAGLNPSLRQRLNEKFARGADNQAFLVESVSAVETVKAMAVEPQFVRRWDNQLAAYVAADFRVTNLGNYGQQLIQFVGKLVNIGILFFGAKLVIENRLTIGQLVAFNMLAQRVSAPVLRLAQLWQEFQQVGVSMERLGDILNTKAEKPQSQQVLNAITGQIQFLDVSFRYRAEGQLALAGVSLDITAGQVIGIVGRSGSGKSTLTRLIQRFYLPESGRVLIDGVDLALADPAWLRRQIGVVLQENILFNRTIRENIAVSDPGTPLSMVIQAAKLAGAHEFIAELPEGYDTMVGEHGSSLSGGQRQRIAIARALVNNPRILIFDEATSALDFETEHIIRQNMRAMCQGRTVIIIAHRLTAVRHAHQIFVMDKGKVVEHGSHDELARLRGQYAQLLSFQQF